MSVMQAMGFTNEQVLDLLDRLPPGPIFKEDGEMVIDAEGRRIA